MRHTVTYEGPVARCKCGWSYNITPTPEWPYGQPMPSGWDANKRYSLPQEIGEAHLKMWRRPPWWRRLFHDLRFWRL
jgi:hypothetical protein